MLACLPGPADLPLQLLPHTQMNAGLHKWDSTQRMRSSPFPSPSELDAYALKVAHRPLTIRIFPNSIKVPQRSHVRRTVNGLDTSGQRYSPYPPTPAKAGLLAVVKAPAVKGVLKDFDGGRARMNPPAGPYQVAPTSTLNHPPPPGLPRPPQGPPLQPQDLPQTLHVPLLQQRGHTLGNAPPVAHHPQGPLPRPQHPALGPPTAMLQQPHLQQAPPPKKLPDAAAPPNVTVSTSTIPLSMAPGLQPGRHAHLSAIVHQINRFCQARAQGGVATSVCEGQIANPSPIGRNLLISACSRVSVHSNPATPGFPHPNCIIAPKEAPALLGAHPPPSATALNHLPSTHDIMQQQLQHLHPHHQQLHHGHAHRMHTWNQHPLGQLAPFPAGGPPLCKQPSRDPSFHFKGVVYPPEVCVGQPYTVKPPVERPTPSPPINGNGPPGTVTHYTNGHYFQPPLWNSSILPTPNSDSSGSQDVAMPFHGAGPAPCATLDCGPPGASHYRVGAGSAPSTQTNLMQTADYSGGDFQTPYFRDQNLGLMGKPQRVGPEGVALLHPPGYR